MPRYYFDTDDGLLPVRDDTGREFAGVRAARDLAQRALREMAQQQIPDGESRVFKISIRDEKAALLYVATLTLAGEWKISPPDA
ncbi:hypothetical protein LOK46_32285 (plasmid) [Methylobacterium sp. NMS14P]|uniref:DUF6894 family protein n=1 Tax=unclassified Methylobacterium TaxID=2615210 RepID=UPI00235887A8|nr:hypothetical protein [Methylobacterium sp. NMS14P]WCS28585.1 hypothetical protein LOK46_32285 [Methylobacterium sp. NMS14P]